MNNILNAYLERFAAPRAHIFRTLNRRLQREREHHPEVEPDDIRTWINESLDNAERLGMVNDRQWALDKTRFLARKGLSSRAIRNKLRQKSTPNELIQLALETLEESEVDTERVAAANVIRKRRMGPFRPEVRRKDDDFRKDLARLARAGFSFDLARQLLELDEESLMDLCYERNRI